MPATADKQSTTKPPRKRSPRKKPADRTSDPSVPTVLQDRFEVELDGNVAADLVKIVKVVALAASKDDARELLTGMLVESDGEGTVTFTATDSYRLHVVTWKPGAVAPWPKLRAVVPAAWLARVLPKRRLHPAWRFELTVADGRVTWLDDAAGERFSKSLIGEAEIKYPSVSRIVPGDEVTADLAEPRGFNPKYLSDIFKAADLFGDYTPVRVRQLDPMKPCRFDVEGRDLNGSGGLRMVLMPVRLV